MQKWAAKLKTQQLNMELEKPDLDDDEVQIIASQKNDNEKLYTTACNQLRSARQDLVRVTRTHLNITEGDKTIDKEDSGKVVGSQKRTAKVQNDDSDKRRKPSPENEKNQRGNSSPKVQGDSSPVIPFRIMGMTIRINVRFHPIKPNLKSWRWNTS